MKDKYFIQVIGLLLAINLAFSSVPQMINYQGFLTDKNNVPINSTVNITFKLYNTISGGSPIWSEMKNSVVVTNGVYSVLLGSSNPITESIFDGSSKYIGIKVANDSEMTPRQEIVSVGYALRAGSVTESSIGSKELTEFVEFGKNGSTGKVTVNDISGDDKVIISGAGQGNTSAKVGTVKLFGENGNPIFYATESTDCLDCGLIDLYGGGENQGLLQLSAKGDISSMLLKGNGKPYAWLRGGNEGSTTKPDMGSSLVLWDQTGSGLYLSTSDAYKPNIYIHRSGSLRILRDDGKSIFSIACGANSYDKGALWIYGSDGNLKATLQVNQGGSGSLYTYTADGSEALRICTDGTGSSEAGYIRVNDKNGDEVISLDGRNGSITGKSKNFRVDHPTNPKKEIFYSSLEGPEVSIFIRGTATLTNGESVIQLPEHFSLLTVSNSITVQLTPLSDKSSGLCVVRKSNREIYIKELLNGKGNYSFDYFIQAIRNGFEDFQVVRDKVSPEIKNVTSMESAPAPAPAPMIDKMQSINRELIKNEQ
ncbi:MAG: hypothetical protein JXB49_27790 [Bacteroidales bacterium]|nr:hypothetical protein [Bacteroidales bacterium]